LFLKDSNGDLVKVGPVHVGTTAPNATPGAGGQAGNSKGEQWLDTSSSRYVFKIWDGTAWRTEDGEFVNVSGDTMTGALGIIAGTNTAPGVFFSGDTNTGIYSPGADQLAISTNGTGRLFVDASGRIILGNTFSAYTPGSQPTVSLFGEATNYYGFHVGDGFDLNMNAGGAISGGQGVIKFHTAANERARIDSSGRLLVGTSSARSNYFNSSTYTPYIQMEGAENESRRSLSLTYGDSTGIGPILILAKHRGTSVGGTNAVSNNDEAGQISFQASDGTEFIPVATIASEVDGTPGADDMPGRLVFRTTADGASTPTERIRITSKGNILINKTTATSGNSNEVVAVSASVNDFGWVATHPATDGSVRAFAASCPNYNGDDGYLFIGARSGGDVFYIKTNGNVQNTNNSYGAISDLKLKENIVNANSQWNDLKALQVRNYNLKEGQTHTQIGLVAQEVELVSPGLVSESPDRDAEGNDLGTVTKSISYSVLYMKAVKALQEAMERIETLETRLTAAGIA
jgi:hypothetical protein